MSNDEQPGIDEIEAYLLAVLEGRLSRDQADRWATRWFTDDTLDWPDLELWALVLLCGIDLRHGPGGDFLHSDEQLWKWLEELRHRRK